MDFRRELANALLFNCHDEERQEDSQESHLELRSSHVHAKVTWPAYCVWADGEWKKKYKLKHQQRYCKTNGCKHKPMLLRNISVYGMSLKSYF